MNDVKEAFQRRNENDFLFRARRLSNWIGSSIDYDEFIAPTRRLEKHEKVWHNKCGFLLCVDVPRTNADLQCKVPGSIVELRAVCARCHSWLFGTS